jgi:hypothetical protein
MVWHVLHAYLPIRKCYCAAYLGCKAKLHKLGLKAKALSAVDVIRGLSSALNMGHDHGLEPYMPKHRRLPGGPLMLVPMPQNERPMLKLIVDESAPGIQACNFMFACGLRGFWDRDLCHRMNNDMNLAINRAGLMGSMAKLLVIMSVNRGPWLGGAFLDQKREALAMYIQALVHDDAEQQRLYELQCWDQGVEPMPGQCPSLVLHTWMDAQTFHNKAGGVSGSAAHSAD